MRVSKLALAFVGAPFIRAQDRVLGDELLDDRAQSLGLGIGDDLEHLLTT